MIRNPLHRIRKSVSELDWPSAQQLVEDRRHARRQFPEKTSSGGRKRKSILERVEGMSEEDRELLKKALERKDEE